MPFTSRGLVIVIVFAVALSAILYAALRSPGGVEEVSLVQIKSYRESAEMFDRDGDDIPDWLEEIAGSDVDDPTSFPKHSDVMIPDDVLAEDLIYEGPGEFTKDISRRLLLGIDDVDSLTKEEQNRFVSDSTDYFLNEIGERSLPEVVLRVDDGVSRTDVLSRFMQALQETAKFKRPLNEYIAELFSQNKNVLREASQAQAHCTRALELFPRAVPADIFSYYFVVLERFVYICEALSVAITSNRSEDYFFVLFLMNTGALYVPFPEGETTEEQIAEVNDRLKRAVKETYYLLQQEE
ncbi:MAG: hypothetical protein OYG31_00600 [Candidatus Kaiserbacteria bacterium]|nr:hypothetical protein [Candidatus Kaiserbacteria bacterium]